MPEEGEPFKIDWRVHGNVNAAEIAYYHQRVEVFMISHHDEDVTRIYATQEWLDENEGGKGTENAEYARAYVEGTVVNPDDPFDHIRIDEPE